MLWYSQVQSSALGPCANELQAGNDKYDLARAEREARERVLANKKLKTLEASIKAKAKAQGENEATDANAALQQAAQLASVRQSESSAESSSSSEGEIDEEGTLLASEQTPSSATPAATSTQDKSKPNSKPVKGSSAKSQGEAAQTPASQGKKRKAKPSQEAQEAKRQKKQQKKAKKSQEKADKADKKAKKRAKNAAATG